MSRHAFASENGHHCAVCGSAQHCPHCEDGCGPQGHTAKDEGGWFFTCVETERTDRWRNALIARLNAAAEPERQQ